MQWRLHRAAAVFGILPLIAATNGGLIQVTGLRSWSHSDSTRVILETTGPFEYKQDHALNPERLFFDIPNSRPWIASRRIATREIGDALVRRVRIAETAPGTTRIVFDLIKPVEVSVTTLNAPDRMVIELRPQGSVRSPVSISENLLPPLPYQASPTTSFKTGPRAFVYPPRPRFRQVTFVPNAPLITSAITDPFPTLSVDAVPVMAARSNRSTPANSTRVLPAARIAPPNTASLPSENATRSLTRALGLKVNRIVIDAGHGGHDDGTIGPHGLLEKDVVLDVALRLSKLIQERMGAEVILTRSDDTFIPLHERTAIANDHKADLFLSIHANSSPSPMVAGTETFYLNFTSAPDAIAVAARENAGADKTVGDLKDLIQSITLNDKIEESHTFAEDIQSSIQAQAFRTNATAKNRGIKRAPFVVLIGASMPSVLAEIGFLSNSRDESNLGKPDYRQKIAEALYRGVSQYSKSLSHFQVASDTAAGEKPIRGGQ